MEQKVAKRSKRPLWSVYVFIRTGPDTFRKYLYLDVVKMYKKSGILYIKTQDKKEHMHELSRIESIQVREYKRQGIQ
jgi:hypothetical protein